MTVTSTRDNGKGSWEHLPNNADILAARTGEGKIIYYHLDRGIIQLDCCIQTKTSDTDIVCIESERK